MADIIDDTTNITINLIQEGEGIITSLNYPTNASVGTSVDVEVTVLNDGPVEDGIFAVVSANPSVTFSQGNRQSVVSLLPGVTTVFTFTFTMPSVAVDIDISTGHIE